MRLLTLIPFLLLPFTFSLDIPTRSLETLNELSARSDETLLEAFGNHGKPGHGHGGHGHPGNQCKNNPLRDPKNQCECKDGLIDLLGSCCCGDQSNTVLTLQGCGGSGGCDKPVCVCDSKHSCEFGDEAGWPSLTLVYDKKKHQCVCQVSLNNSRSTPFPSHVSPDTLRSTKTASSSVNPLNRATRLIRIRNENLPMLSPNRTVRKRRLDRLKRLSDVQLSKRLVNEDQPMFVPSKS